MANKRGHHEGTISQLPSGKWRVQIYISGRRYGSTFRTKEECKAWLRKMLDQSDQGYDHHGGQTLLGEYLPQWLEGHQLSLRPTTAHQYQDLVQRRILPYLGKEKLSDLRTDKLERFYARMISEGVGPRTVRMVHAILHKAFEKAVRYGLLLRNPASGATLPKYRPPEMMVLDEAQVNQFLLAAHGDLFGTLFHLAIVTGMRQGELFGLKWTDLQWHTGALNVRRQVQSVPGQGWAFIEPKTKAGKRVILVGEGMLTALRTHRERQQQITAAGEQWQEHDLVFPSKIGTPLDPSNVRMHFNQVLALAGLSHIRFHDLRHTTVSLLLNNGVPLIVVSRMLGHSKPSVTLDIYGHLYHEMQGQAARVLDELVAPIPVSIPAKELQSVKQNRE